MGSLLFWLTGWGITAGAFRPIPKWRRSTSIKDSDSSTAITHLKQPRLLEKGYDTTWTIPCSIGGWRLRLVQFQTVAFSDFPMIHVVRLAKPSQPPGPTRRRLLLLNRH